MKIVSQHFINGRFVESHGQETVDVHNPATGELIGRSTRGDAVDAERAIAAAKAAFPAWSTTSLEERKRYLQRIADALTERMDELVATTVAEFGAPPLFAGYIDGQARDFFLLVQDLLEINELVDDPISPFGGFKMSGFGREFGIHGLQAYLETRTVFAD
ncbi:aldehyde dehydrogenase family protein [Streptomyces sp. NPDC088766]|uniref:aldehyde dehydrogenase family protein n=1 Tax=Streptomyces sp. NPDC088766 TaxID=3365893 RepID=UPI00380B9731